MTRDTRTGHAPDDWPDEEGGGEGRKSLRTDVGASLERPKEEQAIPPAAGGSAGERGPAGAGQVAGPGTLGDDTPSDKGAEQGPR